MRRVTLTDAQVSALVQELRRLDLSSKPACQDLLRRLERLADRNDAARYPTPPADSEGGQADLAIGENNAQRGRRPGGRKASSSARDCTAWRCDPQDPSNQPNEAATPMQSVFALDTAGAQARASIRLFESRHPQPDSESRTEVDSAELGEDSRDGVERDKKAEEESKERAMDETTPELRKRKRRRTTRLSE